MEMSEILRYIRKKSLLSQNAFAEVLGVSFSTINRWENGKAVSQISMSKRINEFCLANNIPVDVTNMPMTTGTGERLFSGLPLMNRCMIVVAVPA